MLESALGQVVVNMMPGVYVVLLAVFIKGACVGAVLSDLSLLAAISAFLLGKAIPVLLPELPDLIGAILSGVSSALTLGILVGYFPRWFSKEVLGLFRS